jgi:NAD(P)-dependent dehydrogenase (short-subunit alcohol dehydrogenase family)
VRLALVARNMEKLRAEAVACRKAGAKAEVFECDVSNEPSVELMAGAVRARFGRVDVLINNAGAFTMAPFSETKVEEFDRMIAVNLRSAFLVTRAFLPAMRRRKQGDIFFMSSIAGLDAYPHATAYCAAKFGVTGLAKVLRAETKDDGIRVCCIHPGATWSPSWENSGVKPTRIMPADDVARAVLDVYRLGRRAVVEEIVLRPQLGDV